MADKKIIIDDLRGQWQIDDTFMEKDMTDTICLAAEDEWRDWQNSSRRQIVPSWN